MTPSTPPAPAEAISVYWQTGCTSCLRTKEFLSEHGIPFRSRNVLEDASALDELARFGLRQVPIVVRGDAWANGQILRDVAALCGIPWGGAQTLPPQELRRRIETVLATVRANVLRLPQSQMRTNLPDRPRSHADLVYHIFNIVDAFVEQEEGLPLVYESYYRLPPEEMQTPEGLEAYGRHVAARFADWFDREGPRADWTARVDVYYGEQSRHDFLERTTWHCGQHARQLIWVLERLGIEPAARFAPDAFAGLPMPAKVWDTD